MAIPSRVITADEYTATVECFGQVRTANLLLLSEPVAPGDYLLLQAGGFAYEKIDAERARETLALMEQVIAGEDVVGVFPPDHAGI